MADKERDELLRRFTDVIGEPAGSVFFEEDELVEIYDYAGDLNDDFIKSEVLLWGARLYPESIQLAERRSLMYYEQGNDSAAEKVISKVKDDSVIKRLIMLRIGKPRREEAIEELANIVDSVRDFKDEEIIQFVQTAYELNLYLWLKDYKDIIQKKCSFPQSFLFELVGIAEESGDFDFAIQLLEELTEIEPFNQEFWELTADFYNMHFDSPEKTLTAAEYSLALNPESTKSLILKAKAYYELGHGIEEVEPMVATVLKKQPKEKGPVLIYSLMLSEHGQNEKAVKTLTDYMDKYPGDRLMINTLIMNTLGEFDTKYLKAYYNAEKPDAESVVDWANDMLQLNYPKTAIDILDLLPDELRDQHYYNVWIESMFALREYDILTKVFNKLEDDGQSPWEYPPHIMVIRILSACSSEMSDDLKLRILTLLTERYDQYSTPGDFSTNTNLSKSFESSGIRLILRYISEKMVNGDRVDPDLFNCYLYRGKG